MSNEPINQFIQKIESPFNIGDLLPLVHESPNHCFFIKNEHSRYLFANDNFIRLMGLSSLQQLRLSSDDELSSNKHDSKKYRDLDCCVVEEGHALTVSEAISPRHHPSITKTMQGKLYPLFSRDAQARYVLGIVVPETKLLKLDWETVFQLSTTQLDDLLIKRSYPIKLDMSQITLSKMEVKTLIQLLKGEHSGEIAVALKLKQTTVESYLGNIKNKLGVGLKSELIHRVISTQLLQQIII